MSPRVPSAPRALVALALACACRTAPAPPHPTVAPSPPESLPDPITTPVNREPGELLDATVPLVDGDGLPLAGLRGRVVVLELTATWTERWPETFAFYTRLLQQHGPDRLAVVVVAMDNERAALSPEPGLRGRGFDLGWDPQGALAARLQVAALPTVVVLDRQGRVAFVQGGAGAGSTVAIEDGIRRALAAP
ncbi:MAG: TlpA family protein disulfide reductase [Myxococcales bacterium]|nr:TlpA family protein disulfide reductase [Myxococcales bacterium]